MSADQDAELTRELEALVAAKEQQQRTMKTWFAAALASAVLAIVFRHPWWAAAFLAALAVAELALGMRAHLRAAALRGQAMEKILAEAFRRAGQAPPSSEP